jgi:hypothetical protein
MLQTLPSALKPKRTGPLDCPQTVPYLSIVGITPGAMVLRYANGNAMRSAKPRGASELQLFVAITDQHAAALSEARFYRKFTRHLMEVAFEPADDGKVATFYGRWASHTGDTGPWSLPVSIRIVA